MKETIKHSYLHDVYTRMCIIAPGNRGYRDAVHEKIYFGGVLV